MPPKKKKKVKTVLYLEPDQLEQLRKIAAKRDTLISRLVRQGVSMVIKKYAGKK